MNLLAPVEKTSKEDAAVGGRGEAKDFRTVEDDVWGDSEIDTKEPGIECRPNRPRLRPDDPFGRFRWMFPQIMEKSESIGPVLFAPCPHSLNGEWRGPIVRLWPSRCEDSRFPSELVSGGSNLVNHRSRPANFGPELLSDESDSGRI